MNAEGVRKAAREAKEFVELAGRLLEVETFAKNMTITGTRLSGAVRRKSLDLTRALADMRKPWNS